jgi:hypothetical protein
MRLTSLLEDMMPKLPRAIVEGFPPDEYLLDNPLVGFLRTPKKVKVISGDAAFPADYRYAAVRQWLIEFLTPDTFLLCLNSISSVHTSVLEFIREETPFWRAICAVVGTGIVKLIAPHIKDTESVEFLTTLTGVVAGLNRALRYFPSAARQVAVSEVIRPFLRLLTARSDLKSAAVFSDLVQAMLTSRDFRRVSWLADFGKELLAAPGSLKKGLAIVSACLRESHFRFHGDLLAIVKEHVLPRVRPLSAITIPELDELASILRSQLGLGLGRDVEIATPRILFEDIFDAELGKSDDRLAMLLAGCRRFVGPDHILPLISDRIVKIFLLRNSVSQAAEAHIETYIRWVGRLNWYLLPDKLGEVFGALQILFPTTSVAVKSLVVEFVHTIAFTGMLRIPAKIHRQIFDEFIPLFVGSEIETVREGGIGLGRMLIPLAFGSFEEFWAEEVVNQTKTGRLSAANGIALLGATFVLDRIPKWLPELLELLEGQHKKERNLAKRIEEEFARFWEMIGPREFPEIEDYRFAFSPRYYS